MTDKGAPTTDQIIGSLLSQERAEELDPFTVLTFMPIEPHHHVADIGCGPGYFSIPFAKHLIQGKLYAMDIVDRMLDMLRQRVNEAKLGNVEILRCKENSFPVPAGSLDGVFLAFVIHENSDHANLLNAAQRLLKPYGWCTVLEWYKQETDSGPPVKVRIAPHELESLAKDIGFEYSGSRNLTGRHYMSVLKKRSSA